MDILVTKDRKLLCIKIREFDQKNFYQRGPDNSAPSKIQVINIEVMLSRKALPCRVNVQWLLVTCR